MLKEIRKQRGYTLETLSEKCGISWRNLQRIENGKIGSTKFQTIQKLIEELNMQDKEIIKLIKTKV